MTRLRVSKYFVFANGYGGRARRYMDENKNSFQAKTLVEALPYIRQFAGQTIVVKYGGSIVSQQKAIESLANDIALLRFVGIKPVIVHGGGGIIQKWLKRFGKEQRIVDGEPHIDAETLEIIDMVLTGNVSNFIVSSLTKCGVRALGLSGRDAQIFTPRRIKYAPKKDLGYMGEIESTEVKLINKLIEDNYVPVISSVGISRDGTILNVESDFVAAVLASSLRATKLIYLSSKEGISDGGELLGMLDLVELEELIKKETPDASLSYKLKAALAALKGGVKDVHIISGIKEHAVLLEIFTDQGIGTMITNQKMKI
jgi:acetylglutamate kinase